MAAVDVERFFDMIFSEFQNNSRVGVAEGERSSKIGLTFS
jgi:hypothetical protein